MSIKIALQQLRNRRAVRRNCKKVTIELEIRFYVMLRAADDPSVSQFVFTITEKAPTRAFSWLKAATTAFTFKTLC